MSGAPAPVSVSVAIPTFRREAALVRTVRQVLDQEPPADEILVVDQTDRHDPPTEAFLGRCAAAGRVRWIRHGAPNLPSARNRALREASSEVVLFIDDDVELPKDLVGRHAANYSDAAVVAVCGRVVQARGSWSIPSRRGWPRRFDSLYFRPDGRERVSGIAALQGGNHSVRRESVIAKGGYDENYIGWAFREESDLALRLWRGGGLIVFDPEAWLTHLQEPKGGCRYEERERPLPDWMIAFPGAYFAMRHLFPTREFWKEILVWNFLRSVARMPNARRPWRLPFAVVSYAVGVARAAARARAAGDAA
jgi:glycosyltransferase involved in cell wall biosynthesis